LSYAKGSAIRIRTLVSSTDANVSCPSYGITDADVLGQVTAAVTLLLDPMPLVIAIVHSDVLAIPWNFAVLEIDFHAININKRRFFYRHMSLCRNKDCSGGCFYCF
jgi:hypothetical protein